MALFLLIKDKLSAFKGTQMTEKKQLILSRKKGQALISKRRPGLENLLEFTFWLEDLGVQVGCFLFVSQFAILETRRED